MTVCVYGLFNARPHRIRGPHIHFQHFVLEMGPVHALAVLDGGRGAAAVRRSGVVVELCDDNRIDTAQLANLSVPC
jgi:hypothetical protein